MKLKSESGGQSDPGFGLVWLAALALPWLLIVTVLLVLTHSGR